MLRRSRAPVQSCSRNWSAISLSGLSRTLPRPSASEIWLQLRPNLGLRLLAAPVWVLAQSALHSGNGRSDPLLRLRWIFHSTARKGGARSGLRVEELCYAAGAKAAISGVMASEGNEGPRADMNLRLAGIVGAEGTISLALHVDHNAVVRIIGVKFRATGCQETT